MIVKNQKTIIKWNPRNKKHYVSKGYEYTSMGNEFKVNITDLTKGSKVKIKCICDYCGKEILKSFRNCSYITKDTDCCQECISKKRKETFLEKYGVDNPAKLDKIKEKIKQTNLKKYGVENPMQNEKIQDKAKQTNLQKYGTEYLFQSEEVKDKIKQSMKNKYGVEHYSKTDEFNKKVRQTSLEKYGVKHPFQSERVKNKIKQSMKNKYGIEHNMKCKEGYEEYKQGIIDKYGVDNISKVDSVKKKIRKSLYKNNTVPSSRCQRYLHQLLGGKLNYPIKWYSLDIAFPKEKIYIEYDGSGHDLRVKKGNISYEEFKWQECTRKSFLENKGWKIIRIISQHDKLPLDKKNIKLINKAKQYLINTNHTWVEININNKTYKCSQYEENIDFKQLRYINKKDLK
jgi:very-short-patch-repair endonuclease